MAETPRLRFPLLDAAQAQKHVTHNEALLRLDALAQLVVATLTASPPAAPADGALYLVAPGGAGAFAGHDGEVAQFCDGTWRFLAPAPGWRAVTADDGVLRLWTGSIWKDAFAGLVQDGQGKLGVNTTADAVNRLSVSAQAALLTHDPASGSGHVRCVLNKAGAASIASVLFQSGWSGRAEIGVMDADMLRIRTSLDGQTWTTRLSIDPASGAVGLGRPAPLAPLDVVSTLGAGLRLSSTGSATAICNFDGAAGAALCDFDLLPATVAGGASLRFFRYTATSGPTTIMALRGDGSAAVNALIGGNGNSYFNLIGNVGVGTATPDAKLSVAGAVAPATDNAHTLGTSAKRWSTVFAATGVINTSDARLKTDVRDCPLGLDFLRALTPRLYRWRAGACEAPSPPAPVCDDLAAVPRLPDPPAPRTRAGRRAHLGLIAQEVKQALDRAGVECGLWTLADPDDPESVQSLRYEEMIAPLVQAVKELDARLARLERGGARA